MLAFVHTLRCQSQIISCGRVLVAALGLLSLVGLVPSAQAGTNTWTSVGPFGGQVKWLAIDPKSPATLYAVGQLGGVFKSTNSGGQWTRITTGMTDPFSYYCITIDPSNHEIVYVCDAITLYKSTNGGSSWTSLSSGGGLFGLVVDPQSSSRLYAILNGATVSTSTNGGQSWTQVGSGLPSGAAISNLAINPTTPATLYAATTQGVYKTVNSGGSWSPSNTGLPTNMQVYLVRIDPTSSSHLFAVGISGNAGVIYQSTNAGASWSAFPSKGLTAGIVDFEIDPKTPGTLYVALGGGYGVSGVFVNKNGAATWTAVDTGLGVPLNTINQIAINPTTAATLYAATNNGVFSTTNGGSKWQAVNKGLANTQTTVLAIAPSSPATLYAGTLANGIFKSTNSGGTWAVINNGLEQDNALPITMSIAVDPSNPQHLLAGFEFANASNLAQSTNGGSSWSYVAALNNAGTVYSIAFNPTNAKAVLAGTDAGLYSSSNGGTSWTLLNPSPSGIRSNAVPAAGGLPPGATTSVNLTVLDPLAQGVGMLLLSNDQLTETIYETTKDGGDSGADWTEFSEPSDIEMEPTGLFLGGGPNGTAVSVLGNKSPPGPPAVSQNLSVNAPTKRFHGLSTIQLNKWVPWASPKGINPDFCPPVPAFAQNPSTLTTIYAGGNYGCGVLEGTNFGQTVTPMNTGLPYQSLAVNALAITPNGCDLYAGTGGGSVYSYTFKRSGC